MAWKDSMENIHSNKIRLKWFYYLCLLTAHWIKPIYHRHSGFTHKLHSWLLYSINNLCSNSFNYLRKKSFFSLFAPIPFILDSLAFITFFGKVSLSEKNRASIDSIGTTINKLLTIQPFGWLRKNRLLLSNFYSSLNQLSVMSISNGEQISGIYFYLKILRKFSKKNSMGEHFASNFTFSLIPIIPQTIFVPNVFLLI